MRLAPLTLLAAATAVAGSSAAGTTFPADALDTYTSYATLVRRDTLNNSYDQRVPPTSVRTASYSRAGTDVSTQIRFFKVREVSATEGRMALKVWWRMWWSDTRLSWDPLQCECAPRLEPYSNLHIDS